MPLPGNLGRIGWITWREHEAGDRYRGDCYLAAIDPAAGTVDWDAAGGGGMSAKVPSMFTSQAIADARFRVRDVEKAIPRRSTVSVVLYLGLIREHTLEEIGRSVFARGDRKEAAVAGYAGIRVALAALADYYGL